MKNIYGILLFVSILGAFFYAPPLGAEPVFALPWTDPYAFSAGSIAGVLYGQGREIVYKYPDESDYLSQLLWDLKPLIYMGTVLSYSPAKALEKPGLFAELSFKAGIPQQTGIMEDRDWLNDYNELLTNYSRHDNFTRGAILVDGFLGASFPVEKKALIKWYGAVSVMFFNWESRDGYLQYAETDPSADPPSTYPWSESIPKTYVYGRGITYSQQWLILSPGMSFHVFFSDRLNLGFYVQLSPYIWCSAQDDHLSQQFIDITSGGFQFEPKAELIFSPAANLELVLHASCRQIAGSRGDTYSRASLGYQAAASGEIFSKERFPSAGVGYAALDAGFSVKIRF
jgi:outer membrane protease